MSLDGFINIAVVTVTSAALGTQLFTQAQLDAYGARGNWQGVVLQPSGDCYLVDGTALGTVANSPYYVPAGIPKVVNHKCGQLTAISVTGAATMKVSPFFGHA